MLLSFHACSSRQQAGCNGSIWCMGNLSPVQLLLVWLVLDPSYLLGNGLERLVALGCVVCMCRRCDVKKERGRIGSRSRAGGNMISENSSLYEGRTYRQSSSWPDNIELGIIRIERDDRRSSQFDESTKARDGMTASSWECRESRAVAVDNDDIDRHKTGRAANKEWRTSFSVVPPNNIKLTKGIFLKTSFWNRGTSDRYRETPRPAVIPQIARVGLKRLMTLFVLRLYYDRGEDARNGDWIEWCGGAIMRLSTRYMQETVVGLL